MLMEWYFEATEDRYSGVCGQKRPCWFDWFVLVSGRVGVRSRLFALKCCKNVRVYVPVGFVSDVCN